MTVALAPHYDAAWNPLNQQSIEPDTTVFFDPDGDSAAGILPGYGAWLAPRGVTNPAYVAGKFLKGFAPATSAQYVCIPCDGTVGVNEFTIEFWAQNPTTDWSAATPAPLIAIGDTEGSQEGIKISAGGTLSAVLEHRQNPASPSSYSKTANATLTSGQAPAATWVNVAVTLSGGVIKLYRNGVQVATVSGFVSPQFWGAASQDDGIVICGQSGTGSVGWAVSDLRISRQARTPSKAIIATNRSVVTVTSATTGKTIQPLAGQLHYLEYGSSVTGQPNAGAIHTIRSDKFLSATPIKAGGTDGTHPTLGHSGSFSYDWQVVDRTLNYFVNTLGCEPYISLDSVPQILGGGAPLSGSQLTSGYTFFGGYSPGPPNNNASFATMCADLVWHIHQELSLAIPPVYYGLWNEPDDTPNFWEGGGTAQTDYQALYNAVATAVAALGLGVKLGGPEIANWRSNQAWIHNFITYCGAHSLPLDFISWHHYTGNLGEYAQVAAQVAAWATTAGIAQPKLIQGESSWQIGNIAYWPWFQPKLNGGDPGPDKVPTNYLMNDWAAAYLAACYIQAQAQPVVRHIFCDPQWGPYASDATIDTSGNPQVNYNVMRLWSPTSGNNVLTSSGPGTSACDPGVLAVCSKNGGSPQTVAGITIPANAVCVLLSSIHYRKTSTYPVLIDVSGAGVADGTNVTTYMVDDQHSNALEAGNTNSVLQTGLTNTSAQGQGKVSGGAVGITLRPRAAALLVIG